MSVATTTPRVTIAIPNYNMGWCLEGAIESALAQTCDDFELLIVNNASTDGSWEVIERWAAKDRRVVPVNYQEHVLAMESWNRCLKHARGEYIVFLHADDRLRPEFLQRCLEVFARVPELGYVYSDMEFINDAGEVTGRQQFYRGSGIIPKLGEARVNLLGWHTVPVQMLIRTACMREIGGYEFSDILPVLKLNLKWDVGYRAEALVQYRQHEGSVTSQYIKDKTLIMALYLTKMLVLNYCLTGETQQLAGLKPRVQERCAYTCLVTYCMHVLGQNERQLCQEYLWLARSFWPAIDQTPLFEFLQSACSKEDWTPGSLQAAWREVAPAGDAGAPYPLPEGSIPFP